MRMTMCDSRRKGKHAWAAEITGRDPEVWIRSAFLRGQRTPNAISFNLEPGRIYDIAEHDRGLRGFVQASLMEDEPQPISYSEVDRSLPLSDDGFERPLLKYPPVSWKRFNVREHDNLFDLDL